MTALAFARFILGGALFVLLASLPAASESLTGLALEFSVPAQAAGNSTLSGPGWIVLVFEEDSQAAFHVELDGHSSAINHSKLFTRAHTGTHWITPGWTLPDLPQSVPADLRMDLGFQSSWASLYIEADSIHLASNAQVELGLYEGNLDASSYLPTKALPPGVVRRIPPYEGVMLGFESLAGENLPFSFEAQGVRRLEWHNATTACASDACPDGARTSGPFTNLPSPLPDGHVATQVMPYLDVQSASGSMRGKGTSLLMASGGMGLDFALEGSARLPQASLKGTCGSEPCEDPAGRTLLTEGNLTLFDLAPIPGREDRIASGMAADLDHASFDESPAGSLVTKAAWIGTATIGLAVLAKIAAAFFARNLRPLLQNPKAKALHDLIHLQPGISFGDLKLATGGTHGNTQYYLGKLAAAGHIVAYQHGNSTRYFENHGRYENEWRGYSALRKPHLRHLHQWLMTSPGVMQAQIVEAGESWGWKRSTTQHKLKLLVAAGLVESCRAGRTTFYTALPVRPPARLDEQSARPT